MKPKRKVSAAGVGGAIGVLAVYVFGIEDAEVGAAISTVAAFVLGYLVGE